MLMLFRWPLLLGLAFLAGVLVERNAALQACETTGGQMVARLCVAAPS